MHLSNPPSGPPQDSDAELENFLGEFVPCMCNFTDGFAYRRGVPCHCEQSEAKQSLLALKARWETEARIDELRILWPRFTDIQVNGTNGPDDNPAARKCIDNRLATLQNQLPTKETK